MLWRCTKPYHVTVNAFNYTEQTRYKFNLIKSFLENRNNKNAPYIGRDTLTSLTCH